MTTFNPSLGQISAHGLIPFIQKLGENLVGCEIGICRGHNLRYLLDRIPTIKTIYAVDPWLSYFDGTITVSQNQIDAWKGEATALLDPFKDKVVIINSNSKTAVNSIQDHSLDYVFIDGDHSYDHVLEDVRLYWNKVKPGGLFSGHDYQMADVKRAVAQFREERNITEPIQFTEQNVWFWYKNI